MTMLGGASYLPRAMQLDLCVANARTAQLHFHDVGHTTALLKDIERQAILYSAFLHDILAGRIEGEDPHALEALTIIEDFSESANLALEALAPGAHGQPNEVQPGHERVSALIARLNDCTDIVQKLDSPEIEQQVLIYAGFLSDVVAGRITDGERTPQILENIEQFCSLVEVEVAVEMVN